MAFIKKDRALPSSVALILPLFLLFIAQCSSSNSSSSPDEVTPILAQFDGIHSTTLDLGRMVMIGDSALSDLAKFKDHENADMRWGAVMSLGAIGRQLNIAEKTGPIIIEFLDDPDIWVRVTAAELCVSLGFKEGIPVLIDVVDSDLRLRMSEPPSPIATQATSVLTLYTGQEFLEEDLWWEWWDQNENTLTWNQDDEMFE